MDILERMKIITKTTSKDWPYASIDWEYKEAVKEIESLRTQIAAQAVVIENIYSVLTNYCKGHGIKAEHHPIIKLLAVPTDSKQILAEWMNFNLPLWRKAVFAAANRALSDPCVLLH